MDLGRYEEYDYDALTSLSHDADMGEITLLSSDALRTLRIRPVERAEEIVAVVAARIGEDRVHPRAGAADARVAKRALMSAAVGACAWIGAFALVTAIGDRATPEHISSAECLDIEGSIVSCNSSGVV